MGHEFWGRISSKDKKQIYNQTGYYFVGKDDIDLTTSLVLDKDSVKEIMGHFKLKDISEIDNLEEDQIADVLDIELDSYGRSGEDYLSEIIGCGTGIKPSNNYKQVYSALCNLGLDSFCFSERGEEEKICMMTNNGYIYCQDGKWFYSGSFANQFVKDGNVNTSKIYNSIFVDDFYSTDFSHFYY